LPAETIRRGIGIQLEIAGHRDVIATRLEPRGGPPNGCSTEGCAGAIPAIKDRQSAATMEDTSAHFRTTLNLAGEALCRMRPMRRSSSEPETLARCGEVERT
jgi:hypothetical protein